MVGGVEIQRIESMEYLGLHMDANLSWATHIDNLCSQISGVVCVLGKKQFLPKKILRLLYNALVHSHSTYDNMCAVAKNYNVRKIQVL